jgi:hypothetical protein
VQIAADQLALKRTTPMSNDIEVARERIRVHPPVSAPIRGTNTPPAKSLMNAE